MNDLFGIVNFESDRVNVEGLSNHRTIPAFSFLGRYRIVDFILSNMVNSEIRHIKILTKHKARSLIDHIDSGVQYDINSKTGSLQTLFLDHQSSNDMFNTDVALLHQYLSYIEDLSEEYVVIAPSYMICNIDYRDVLKQHIETGAEITCVYKEIHDADRNFLGCEEYEIDENNHITSMSISHGSVEDKFISLETYVMKKSRFVNIIEDASALSSLYTIHDYLQANIQYYNMIGYSYSGYLCCINSLNEYYKANMELLEYNHLTQLFKEDWPIYTKTNDSTPAYYSPYAKVKNSLIANGAVIQGEVENCIVGRGVKVKKGAVVKNSILLPHAVVGPEAEVNYAIIDKNAKIQVVKKITGEQDKLVYIGRREIV